MNQMRCDPATYLASKLGKNLARIHLQRTGGLDRFVIAAGDGHVGTEYWHSISHLMFKEYDCFRLRNPLPDNSVPIGTMGVVLMVFSASDYEVEFPDGNGGNLGLSPTYTLSQEYMETVTT